MTAFEERPHSPYFGTSDATPLFLVLLDEFERWTGRRSWFANSKRKPGPRCVGSIGWRSRRRRLRRVRTAEQEERHRESMLEGLVGFDRVFRRHPGADADRDL